MKNIDVFSVDVNLLKVQFHSFNSEGSVGSSADSSFQNSACIRQQPKTRPGRNQNASPRLCRVLPRDGGGGRMNSCTLRNSSNVGFTCLYIHSCLFWAWESPKGSSWPCSNHSSPCLGINTAHRIPFLTTAPTFPSQATLLKSHGFGNAGNY